MTLIWGYSYTGLQCRARCSIATLVRCARSLTPIVRAHPSRRPPLAPDKEHLIQDAPGIARPVPIHTVDASEADSPILILALGLQNISVSDEFRAHLRSISEASSLPCRCKTGDLAERLVVHASGDHCAVAAWSVAADRLLLLPLLCFRVWCNEIVGVAVLLPPFRCSLERVLGESKTRWILFTISPILYNRDRYSATCCSTKMQGCSKTNHQSGLCVLLILWLMML